MYRFQEATQQQRQLQGLSQRLRSGSASTSCFQHTHTHTHWLAHLHMAIKNNELLLLLLLLSLVFFFAFDGKYVNHKLRLKQSCLLFVVVVAVVTSFFLIYIFGLLFFFFLVSPVVCEIARHYPNCFVGKFCSVYSIVVVFVFGAAAGVTNVCFVCLRFVLLYTKRKRKTARIFSHGKACAPHTVGKICV